MRFYKSILPVMTFAALFTGQARADGNPSVPNTAVVCTISAACEGAYAYYQLKTTFQLIDEIDVDAGASNCSVVNDTAITGPALQKLKTQAQQLKDAGVCAVIIDNID